MEPRIIPLPVPAIFCHFKMSAKLNWNIYKARQYYDQNSLLHVYHFKRNRYRNCLLSAKEDVTERDKTIKTRSRTD